MSHHHKRETCRLCESKKVELVLPLNPTPAADKYVAADKKNEKQDLFPLDLYLCLSCGHVQLLDVVDPAVLFREYLYVTSSSLGLVDHYRAYVDEVTKRYSFKGKPTVVEVGSNDGSFLRFFKDKGFRVLGVDPARDIAERATQQGLETWPEFFTPALARRIRKEVGPAAVVAANNVFAHNDNLAGMADGVQHLLQDDGVFVFEVPYLGDMVEKKMFDTIYHEHLGYHSVGPLQIFLDRHGMELLHVDHNQSKAGSIRCVAQLKGGPHKKDASVETMIATEKQQKLEKPDTYRALAKDLENVRKELKALIKKLKKEGRKIAGYGASPSTTTLIYYFDLQDSLGFLVDDNPLKHGRFSPGCHLPVFPSEFLAKDKPDYVVVFAWTYFKPILDRNEAYRSQGGKFILPLPQLSVN